MTEPNLLQARQAKAQGEFDLVNARSNWEVARANLIEVIGAKPQCAVKVAPAISPLSGIKYKSRLTSLSSRP